MKANLPSLPDAPNWIQEARGFLLGLHAALKLDGRVTLEGTEYQILSFREERWDEPSFCGEIKIDCGVMDDPAHFAPRRVMKSGNDTLTISFDRKTTIFYLRRLGDRAHGTRAIK